MFTVVYFCTMLQRYFTPILLIRRPKLAEKAFKNMFCKEMIEELAGTGFTSKM